MNRFFIKIVFTAFIFTACQPSAIQKLRKAEYDVTLGKQTSFEDIVATLQSNNQHSKEAAIALGRLRNPAALPYLASAIENNNIAAKESIRALGMIGDARAIPVLIQLVKQNSPHARDAITVLGDLKDTRAVPVLKLVVQEQRPYYLQAINALGEIGDKSAVDVLMGKLNTIPDNEPQDIKLRIINDQGTKKNILTFDVPQNLPPKIELVSKTIQPEGDVHFRYLLKDAEFDTLSLDAEFSVNNGVNWHPASVEGRMQNINEDRYQSSIVWRADRDNIPLLSQTQLLFKLTPTDNINNPDAGIPIIVPFDVDSAHVTFKDITGEISGDILLTVNYMNPNRAFVDSLQFHFSEDDGVSWFPASVLQGRNPAGTSNPDSMWVVWSTQIDLPNKDAPKVKFRISGNKKNSFGYIDVLDSLHVDNNGIPTVEFLDFNESDLFYIGYRIQDVEQDTISLNISYSTDQGRSWKRGTISGDISQMGSDRYTGVLGWYSNFDINNVQNTPVRLRIRPFDNDPGLFVDSRDFYLKDTYFTKLTQGVTSGALEVTYSAQDSARPIGQYSTDRGRTWKNASLADVSVEDAQGKKNVKLNWDIGSDVSSQLEEIETISATLDKLGDVNVVPDLLRFSTQKSSPSRVLRRRAVQATRLLDNNSEWVVDGLIASLMHPEQDIQSKALSRLKLMDMPKVQIAVADYEDYWADLRRLTVETNFETKEDAEQQYQHRLHTSPLPTEEDMINYVQKKGMSRTRAEQFIKDLDVVRKQSALRRDYETGRISYKTFRIELEKILSGRDRE